LIDSLAWRGAERPYAPVGCALLAGLVWIVINLLSGGPNSLVLLPGQLILLTTLAAVCAIDSRFGIIPDSLVVALVVAGLLQIGLASSTDGGPTAVWWMPLSDGRDSGHLVALGQRGLEMAVVFVAAASLRMTYRAVRGREGLGFGDVKFIAAATVWTGLAWVPFVVLTAVMSAMGSILILHTEGDELHGNYEIAFGPHLAIGVWLAFLASESKLLS
jgi:leader peptidase (prepilin peptidase)/N-methyltransferase